MDNVMQERLRTLGLTRQENIDHDRMREILHSERDVRLRKEGVQQFRYVDDDNLSQLEADPWTPRTDREARTGSVDVLIIGGGFGGLSAGIAAMRAGAKSILIVDRAGGFGGTWYWNRYPGIRCDIDSRVYLPFLEETGYQPSERYSRGEDILEYSNMLATWAGLDDSGLFHTAVTEMEWDASRSRWSVSTDRGDLIDARFVITQSGLFTRPKLPGIPGLETFTGHSFHSSRWDFPYTGGDATGDLTGLAGKRVALIGTGATAIQCVPHLAKGAKELIVFQRTASSIAPRLNSEVDPDWYAQQQPGWHQRIRDNFNRLTIGDPVEEDLIDDGWTIYVRFVAAYVQEHAEAGGGPLSDEDLWEASERADHEWFAMLNANVDAAVKDPDKAAALKSYYRYFCKRPGFSDEYLQTFDRDNVRLLDTSRNPILRITETGVVVQGLESEISVDCLIFATGFEIGTGWTQQAGYDPVGVDGIRLSEKWNDGPLVFQGMFSAGFPNLFFIGPIKTGLTINYTHYLQEQAQHVGFVLEQCLRGKLTWFDTEPSAEEQYTAEFPSFADARGRWYAECTPGYLNNEGRSTDKNGMPHNNYADGPVRFWGDAESWREHTPFQGLITSSAR